MTIPKKVDGFSKPPQTTNFLSSLSDTITESFTSVANSAISYFQQNTSPSDLSLSLITQKTSSLHYKASILEKKRIDPEVPENAARILNVPPDRINDKEYIEYQKSEAVKELTATKIFLDKPGGDPLAVEIQGLIDDVNTAYVTLMNIRHLYIQFEKPPEEKNI
ncbi:MAG: hypothetical protein ACRDFB_01415 [Rhabdochlamydiaceae bacterium]